MHEVVGPRSQQPRESAKDGNLTADVAIAARERQLVQGNSGIGKTRIDGRVRRAGDLNLPAMPAEVDRELADVLGNSAVGWFERQKHTAHGLDLPPGPSARAPKSRAVRRTSGHCRAPDIGKT